MLRAQFVAIVTLAIADCNAALAKTPKNVFVPPGREDFYFVAGKRAPLRSFRDGPKDQTRNLEIPGSMLRITPE